MARVSITAMAAQSTTERARYRVCKLPSIVPANRQSTYTTKAMAMEISHSAVACKKFSLKD